MLQQESDVKIMCFYMCVFIAFNYFLKIPLNHLSTLKRASDIVLLNISNCYILILSTEFIS